MINKKISVRIDGRIKKIIFREPRMSDAESMTEYINNLVDENAKILFQKKISVNEEKKYLRDLLRRMERNSMISIVADYNRQIVGKGDIFRRKEGANSHVAEFGVGISKDFRNSGIGTKLIKLLIAEAKRKWKTKVVKLGVCEGNDNAKHVYEKLGFQKAGKIPKGYKYRNRYIDEIIMFKVL